MYPKWNFLHLCISYPDFLIFSRFSSNLTSNWILLTWRWSEIAEILMLDTKNLQAKAGQGWLPSRRTFNDPRRLIDNGFLRETKVKVRWAVPIPVPSSQYQVFNQSQCIIRFITTCRNMLQRSYAAESPSTNLRQQRGTRVEWMDTTRTSKWGNRLAKRQNIFGLTLAI